MSNEQNELWRKSGDLKGVASPDSVPVDALTSTDDRGGFWLELSEDDEAFLDQANIALGWWTQPVDQYLYAVQETLVGLFKHPDRRVVKLANQHWEALDGFHTQVWTKKSEREMRETRAFLSLMEKDRPSFDTLDEAQKEGEARYRRWRNAMLRQAQRQRQKEREAQSGAALRMDAGATPLGDILEDDAIN